MLCYVTGFLQSQPSTYTSKYFRHCLFWLLQQFLGLSCFTFQHFKFIYLLSDYKYSDANLFVLMRYAYLSFRQNLRYVYTVYFDICTTLFQQVLVVFNRKQFKQIRQVHLLAPLKKRCYTMKKLEIYSIYIEEREWVKAKIILSNCLYIEKFRLLGIICKCTKFGF